MSKNIELVFNQEETIANINQAIVTRSAGDFSKYFGPLLPEQKIQVLPKVIPFLINDYDPLYIEQIYNMPMKFNIKDLLVCASFDSEYVGSPYKFNDIWGIKSDDGTVKKVPMDKWKTLAKRSTQLDQLKSVFEAYEEYAGHKSELISELYFDALVNFKQSDLSSHKDIKSKTQHEFNMIVSSRDEAEISKWRNWCLLNNGLVKSSDGDSINVNDLEVSAYIQCVADQKTVFHIDTSVWDSEDYKKIINGLISGSNKAYISHVIEKSVEKFYEMGGGNLDDLEGVEDILVAQHKIDMVMALRRL